MPSFSLLAYVILFNILALREERHTALREMRYEEWKSEGGEQTFKCKPPNEKAVLYLKPL